MSINPQGLGNRMVRPEALRHRPAAEASGACSPSELAREWGVSLDTVYRDIRKGALKASRIPSGRFRIRREDARKYGRPVE